MIEHPPARVCQPCTACCEGWLRIEKEAIRATLGAPCAHCEGAGCRIYDTRPVDPCRNFTCAWRASGSPLAEWMRPDQCKAIVMFDRLRWRGQPCIVAVAVGATIPLRTLDWLKQYAQQNIRPLLWEEYEQVDGRFTGRKRVAVHGPSEFAREMFERHSRGEQLW
jgi:hypothetical protein